MILMFAMHVVVLSKKVILLTTATCDIAYSIKVSIKRKLIPARYIPYPILAYIRSDSYLVS